MRIKQSCFKKKFLNVINNLTAWCASVKQTFENGGRDAINMALILQVYCNV